MPSLSTRSRRALLLSVGLGLSLCACASNASEKPAFQQDAGSVMASDAGADRDAAYPDAGQSTPDAGHPARDAGQHGSFDASLPGADGGAQIDAHVPTPDAGMPGSDAGMPGPDAGSSPCQRVDGSSVVTVGTASAGAELALLLPAHSLADTRWQSTDNQALILEVYADQRFLGHLVLHQGARDFTYTMQLGAITQGQNIGVRVSDLSAAMGEHAACLGTATLATAEQLGMDAAGLANAPVFLWPREKRFDDLPMILGYSHTLARYEIVYTNENGGTTESCGGGSKGVQALFARWGRGADIENAYEMSKTPASWLRCTGRTDTHAHALRMEGTHPQLYYGDGHNRLFESRGGYGQTCGTGSQERADGNLKGWNSQNPGNDASLDEPYVVRIRPLPVSLDDITNYLVSPDGRREALADHYAPWLYGITFAELTREGKIDNSKTFPMERYVFMDVHAADVGGKGDSYCATLLLKSGFKMRVVTRSGSTLSGPQITNEYFPDGDTGWKRVAFPLDRAYAPGEIASIVFDAYDNDGIYFLDLGDVFMPTADGPNGASLNYLHHGVTSTLVYVDDDSGGCTNGKNTDGPAGGPAGGYPCVGGDYSVVP